MLKLCRIVQCIRHIKFEFDYHFLVKVECSSTNMVLTLHYKGFQGRMFAVGYSEQCGVSGHNKNVTTLVLPIITKPEVYNRCGVFVAQSVGYGNRYYNFVWVC